MKINYYKNFYIILLISINKLSNEILKNNQSLNSIVENIDEKNSKKKYLIKISRNFLKIFGPAKEVDNFKDYEVILYSSIFLLMFITGSLVLINKENSNNKSKDAINYDKYLSLLSSKKQRFFKDNDNQDKIDKAIKSHELTGIDSPLFFSLINTLNPQEKKAHDIFIKKSPNYVYLSHIINIINTKESDILNILNNENNNIINENNNILNDTNESRNYLLFSTDKLICIQYFIIDINQNLSSISFYKSKKNNEISIIFKIFNDFVFQIFCNNHNGKISLDRKRQVIYNTDKKILFRIQDSRL
jgi:hypothetical protein